MFSRKRLAYILIITVIFGALFFLFNLDYDFLRSQAVNEADKMVPSEPLSATLTGQPDAGYLVIGDPQNDSEALIKTNVLKALSLIKSEVTVLDTVTESDLSGDEILIFVVADVSLTGDLEEIAQDITNGGKAIFAAGIPATASWRYLDPLWGILERGSYRTVSTLTFKQDYFPYEEITVNDGFASYSTSLRLNDRCEILIEGDNELPLVWTHSYESGRISMINGTFMESKLSLGILIAAINSTREYALYPIQGTKTVFLDAIPPLFDGNDDHSFEYYGRSAESFVRDKLWGVLLQKAILLDIRLTSSFLAIDKQDFDAQNANQQTFSYISREIIRNKGEITLSGNHVDLTDLSIERIEQTKAFFDKFFPNYHLYAYMPLYGKIDQTQIDAIRSIYSTIRIIRLQYESDQTTQTSGDYAVIDGQVIFPTTTYGYKAEGLQLYTFLSVLTSHGSISHSFDINSLFTVPSSESNWNTLNKSFDVLSTKYFEKTPWLEALTISWAAEKVRALDALSYQTQTTEDQVTVACTQMTVGQKFMFYSTKPILSATGATFRRINDRYTLITAQAASFTLVY